MSKDKFNNANKGEESSQKEVVATKIEVVANDEAPTSLDTALDNVLPKVKVGVKERNLKPIKRLAKFSIVGLFVGIFGLANFTLLIQLCQLLDFAITDWTIVLAECVSVIFTSILSFLINSKFTFSDRLARKAGIWLYIGYYVVTTPLFSLLILWLHRSYGIDLIYCKMIKIALNAILDYFYCQFFIFKYLKKRYALPDKEIPII
ncbi:MAG: GtrA family protein [Clostridia bacterium]